MEIFSDDDCLGYAEPGHPERPERVAATSARLRERHEGWSWPAFEAASEADLLRAHSTAHLERLRLPRRFDADTAYHEDIDALARLACGAALAAMEASLAGRRGFALMRPPGHHAEREQAMGFCYVNHAAVAALAARSRGVGRVAVWDFDAHHGNGTEAILRGVEGTLYVSAHQHPCYPGTGAESAENCRNYPVAPGAAAETHMARLRDSWEEALSFDPELVLVSAGFDAYEHDPITQMSLRATDFEVLGTWLAAAEMPVAGLLEGGYSPDLPELVDAFLSAWEG